MKIPSFLSISVVNFTIKVKLASSSTILRGPRGGGGEATYAKQIVYAWSGPPIRSFGRVNEKKYVCPLQYS
jgi:hypothetical protein